MLRLHNITISELKKYGKNYHIYKIALLDNGNVSAVLIRK